MSLAPGARLGPYEVLAPLGAGGMGEVFKARDTRLERSVAIKIVSPEFAERFDREAKSISSLNHPNICTLFDVGPNYLVMELLEGETLADRIAKGPLPLDQVIRIGTEIANALDRAHKAGIVHRDLKPSNVMLTKSGAKLLDFGLAKSEASGLGPQASGATVQKALTQEGSIVGTFQYMAPEQIEGASVDARTDIFALGAVLYEMATGRRAFEGKSKASLIANILGAEPKPIGELQPMTPARLDRIVRQCMQKDPDERWQSARDVATELRWLTDAVEAQPRRARSWVPWIAAAVVTSLAIGGMLWHHTVTQRNAPIVRTAILPPDKTQFDFINFGAPPAISPDGTKIVFGAAESGKQRSLWIRSLDSVEAQHLGGTEGGSFPFWSPDGRFVAFFSGNSLKKVEVGGGAPVVIADIPDGRGGSWSPDGKTIIAGGRFTPIYRVPASGGTPVAITKLDEIEGTHRWPEFLPDSRHFLYLGSANGNEGPANTIYAASIDGKDRVPLLHGADDAHYFGGCLIFTRDRILTAQPFDPKRLVFTGDAFPLKEQQVETIPLMSRSMVSISAAGTLVYQTGTAPATTQLTWFDRTGKTLSVPADSAPYSGVTIAPDEKSALVAIASAQANIWQIDLGRGVKTRITFNALDTNPIWSPDGRMFIYSSLAPGRFRFVLRNLATGAEETLLEGGNSGIPAVTGWSSDGQRILYALSGVKTRTDLWWMSLADRKPHLYLGSEFIESAGRFSPDGKWVAYQANDTGVMEVYVAPFPPTGAKWQVSNGGATVPRWRGDGKELYFAGASYPARIMAVPINLESTPQIGAVEKLFEFRLALPSINLFDVTRDGRRFLVNTRSGEDTPPAPLYVVQHFDRELRDALEHRN